MGAPYKTVLLDPTAAAVVAEGDSLALHLKKYNNLAGAPVLGRTPSDVLAAINSHLAENPDYYRGRDVVLSSGATNNPKDLQKTHEQLQILKKAGATVVLIGVGPGLKNSLAGVNRDLNNIADAEQVGFVTPPEKEFDWDAEKKHIGPDANRALFGRVREKLAAAHTPSLAQDKGLTGNSTTPRNVTGAHSP